DLDLEAPADLVELPPVEDSADLLRRPCGPLPLRCMGQGTSDVLLAHDAPSLLGTEFVRLGHPLVQRIGVDGPIRPQPGNPLPRIKKGITDFGLPSNILGDF